ncbi:MAG: EamA family transporter RarD [Anaerovorax sp.]|nr:EamA family transporter RarD [Anaerovorax sp.]
MNQEMHNKTEYKKGLACALGCSLLWGILPVYWKSLQSIDPLLIMFYRLVLCFVLVLFIDLFLFGWDAIMEPLRKKGAKLTFFLAGTLISSNWGIYIWAVNSGFIIQTSIGYYIEPLMVCVFGVIFFHEKLDKYKITAFILAIAGVVFMLVSYRQIPFIAIGLALTFATYAAIKKKVQVNSLLALLYETMFLVPIILPIIIYMEWSGQGAFSTATYGQIALLSFAGAFTAVPLMLFAMAANRIDFITLGVTEYFSPSMGLILGIFIYKEPFDYIQLIAFAFIWIGLVIFTIGGIKISREPQIEGASNDNILSDTNSEEQQINKSEANL